MKRLVHMGRAVKKPADIELFPEPARVFAEWTDELAARFLPVALFDLALVGEDAQGPACFLYYEDVSINFLSWKTEGGLITELEGDWRAVAPFQEPPDLDQLRARPGGYIKFETCEIEIGPPSDYEDWAYALDDKLEQAGWGDGLYALRVGGGYPVYVQGDTPLDDPGFAAQLPAGAYDLAPMDFYLFDGGHGAFQQEMQMT